MENEKIPETDTSEVEKVETEEAYEPKGFARVLNRFFHFKERGSTLKKEVIAGLSVFLVSIAVLLMNTRIICEVLDSDIAGYVGTYLAATIISFVGTLAIGLVCNLPLIQVSSLSMSTSFIALIGADKGLTYYNLLAICLISAIIYVIVVSVPMSRKFVMNALPSSVKKALPVGVGLYMIFYALNKSGIVSTDNGVVSVIDFIDLAPYARTVLIAAIVTVLAFVIFKAIKAEHPFLYSVLVGLIAYFAIGAIIAFGSVFTVDRGYIAAGAENMYTIALGFSSLEPGSVFTKGFDFSGYDGNVFLLFVGGILTFFLMGMYETESVIEANEEKGSSASEEERSKALLVNSITNVLAPIVGSVPMSAGKQSTVAVMDGGRTGMTSVVCSIGYLVSMFTWLFFALLATTTAVVSEYGHATSNSFAEYAQAGFAINDMAMLCLGVFLFKGIRNCDTSKLSEFLPFAATVMGIAFAQNVVMGIAMGMLAYVIVKLFSFNIDTIKSITVPSWVMTAVLAVSIIL